MSKNGKKQGGIILKKYNKIIGLLLAVALLLPGMATKVSAAENDVTRLAGDNRIETSIKISKDAYANGSAAEVVLAGWEGKADALTGTYLASAKKAPLLFTRGGSLDTDLLEELERLGAKTVYALGGTTVISDSLVTALEAKGMKVERVSGDNRFATAVAVAKKVNATPKHVFLAYGWGELPDALAAGPASAKEGMPILLTQNKVDETAAVLKNLGVEKVTILGGESAVSKAVADKLVTDLGAANVNRVSGLDRFETANAVAAKYFAGATKAIVANSNPDNNPDALVAGYFGAMKNAPILLTPATALQSKTAAYLQANIKEAYVVGGIAAVNATVEAEVKTAITPLDLAVVSVSAINGKEVEIKFNKAVLKADVVSGGNLVTANLNVTPLAGANTVGTIAAELSEDGKTLTLTAGSNYFDGQYAVVVQPSVKDLDGNAIKAYSEILTVKDTVRPTVSKVEYTDFQTAKVTFSEPLSSLGTATPSLSDISVGSLAADGKSVTINLSHANVELNKDYTVTIIGAKDAAGNLITPNPTVVTVKKVKADTVKPTVTAITLISDTKFSVKFSEKLNAAPTVAITGETLTVTADADDETLYNVTSATTGARVKTITVSAFTDLSGNPGDTYSKVVSFVADTTDPSVVSTRIEKISGVEHLIVTFDENVNPENNVAINGKIVKDFVETILTPAITTNTSTNFKLYKPVATKSKSVQLDISALNTGDYTLTLPVGLVKDEAGNSNKAKTGVTFTRTSDVDVNKPALVAAYDGNGIKVDTNTSITVKFDRKLDVATALNVNNYVIEGVTVKSAIFTANPDGGDSIVRLTLDNGSITINGERTVIIKNIKSADGVVMDTVITSEGFKENVMPTVLSAAITAEDEITVTFSEAVTATVIGDFTVFVGTETATRIVSSATLASNKKSTVLKLSTAFTADDLGKDIVIKKAAANAVVDTNENALDFTSTQVAK